MTPPIRRFIATFLLILPILRTKYCLSIMEVYILSCDWLYTGGNSGVSFGFETKLLATPLIILRICLAIRWWIGCYIFGILSYIKSLDQAYLSSFNLVSKYNQLCILTVPINYQLCFWKYSSFLCLCYQNWTNYSNPHYFQYEITRQTNL